ncbi:MAG: hypothetical protein ALECFALPRED_001865 [Alectoria fallacina]|uniref:Uncharacterized protein n=1 Tax=Alectoria fallacina TaxID=1903189 RepID=A0A8H3IPZ7_9LECA|nr:MAG: hypothetical protein ALECFALPRED_001865 [Alectoria fallacina]
MFNTFRSSGMPNYEIAWPRWTTEEIIVAVFFCSRGIEVPDVANLIEYKLHRRPRRREGFKSQMDKINLEELRNGRRRLCINYMADWDMAAVDDFIIRQTDDTDLLRRLLWFGNEHIPLLETVRPITTSLDTSFADSTMASVPRHTSKRDPGPGRYATREGQVDPAT